MSQQPQAVAECLEVSWKVSGLQFTLETQILLSLEEGDSTKGWQAALPWTTLYLGCLLGVLPLWKWPLDHHKVLLHS